MGWVASFDLSWRDIRGQSRRKLAKCDTFAELITATLEDYKHLAIELARNSEKLAIVQSRLAENRLTTPLFDTKLFTEHIEAAYTAMWERHKAGLAPDHIVIPNS